MILHSLPLILPQIRRFPCVPLPQTLTPPWFNYYICSLELFVFSSTYKGKAAIWMVDKILWTGRTSKRDDRCHLEEQNRTDQTDSAVEKSWFLSKYVEHLTPVSVVLVKSHKLLYYSTTRIKEISHTKLYFISFSPNFAHRYKTVTDLFPILLIWRQYCQWHFWHNVCTNIGKFNTKKNNN